VPYLSNQTPWFTFLVHPRDVVDLAEVGGSSLIRQHSATEEEFVARMCMLPPTVVGRVTFGFSPAWGELLAIIRMPGVVMRGEGQQLIADSLDVAASRGSRVVGLGALTAPATRGGTTLLARAPKGITLTTGNAFTAAIARQNVDEAVGALGRAASSTTVAVVGATGSVGSCLAHLLADRDYQLVLIGRTMGRVESELRGLAGRARLSADLRDVVTADVVVLVTSHPSSLLTPELARPGSIVIDLAQPVNVQPSSYPDFVANQVTVAQGGLVRIPGYQCTTDLRLPDRSATLACLAETFLFAREGIREHSVGNASPSLARELERVAPMHGFSAQPLVLSDMAGLTVA
jgi:fatty aldehyde-generating acyl-ACP reductase